MQFVVWNEKIRTQWDQVELVFLSLVRSFSARYCLWLPGWLAPLHMFLQSRFFTVATMINAVMSLPPNQLQFTY